MRRKSVWKILCFILLFLYGTQTVLAAGGKRQRENLSVSGGEMSKVVLKENDANGTETRGVAENETEETETENGRTEMEGTEVDEAESEGAEKEQKDGEWEDAAQDGKEETTEDNGGDVQSDSGNAEECITGYSGDGRAGTDVLTYRAYCQSYGWKDWTGNGTVSGTLNEAKRLEALEIKTEGLSGVGVRYQAHVQSIGWQGWKQNGETAGSVGQSLRVEAIRIELTGINAGKYDIYYRAYCQTYGWLDWAKNGQLSGTIGMSKRMEAFQILLQEKGGAAPGSTSDPYRSSYVARIGNSYYTTLKQALEQAASGAKIYVFQNCTFGDTLINKSFSVIPEEKDITITYAPVDQNEANDSAGMFRSGMDQNYIWEFGSDNCKLYLNGNGYCNTGVICAPGTVALKNTTVSGSRTNGIFSYGGTIRLGQGSEIHQCKHSGAVSITGTIEMSGGVVQSISGDGLRAKTVKVQGGTIQNNGGNGAATTSEAGSTSMTVSGGSIRNNSGNGIYLGSQNKQAVLEMTGGTVEQNKGYGILHPGNGKTAIKNGELKQNQKGGIRSMTDCTFSGGVVSGNLGTEGGGIYVGSTLEMTGGTISSNQANKGGGIFIGSGKTAKIRGGKITGNQSANTGSGIYQNGTLILMEDACVSEDNEVYLEGGNYAQVSGKLLQKKVARLTPSSYALKRLCVKRTDGGKASEIFEQFMLTENSPYLLRPGDYQSGTGKAADTEVVLSRSYPVEYRKNLEEDVEKLPGSGKKYWQEIYKIPENVPEATGRTFRGWDETALSLKDKKNPKYQAGDKIAVDINQAITLYAAWKDTNHPPVLYAERKLDFLEGETVTKEMLLAAVRAEDEEDGDLTDKIQIKWIRYGAGRVQNGQTLPETTVEYESDMSEEERLDTWFMELPKESSPAEHRICYYVEDGNQAGVSMECTIRVRYNEFPEIETEDRYFTLEEAKNGAITQEELLARALEKKKVKISDKELDAKEPGKLKEHLELTGFDPEEFRKFQKSGYVVLGYRVYDGIGPDGTGKETRCQFTVHVIEDGEVAEAKPVRYVRFINMKMYHQSEETGGLNENSKWYQDGECKELLQNTWKEEKEDLFTFDQAKCEKMKQYIEIHGIGNSVEEQGLQGFYKLMKKKE